MNTEAVQEISYEDATKVERNAALRALGIKCKFSILKVSSSGRKYFSLALLHNDNIIMVTEYNQGSGIKDKPTTIDGVYCLFLDADSYENAGTLINFYKEYGYEDIDEANRAFEACKLTHSLLQNIPSEIRAEITKIIEGY